MTLQHPDTGQLAGAYTDELRKFRNTQRNFRPQVAHYRAALDDLHHAALKYFNSAENDCQKHLVDSKATSEHTRDAVAALWHIVIHRSLLSSEEEKGAVIQWNPRSNSFGAVQRFAARTHDDPDEIERLTSIFFTLGLPHEGFLRERNSSRPITRLPGEELSQCLRDYILGGHIGHGNSHLSPADGGQAVEMVVKAEAYGTPAKEVTPGSGISAPTHSRTGTGEVTHTTRQPIPAPVSNAHVHTELPERKEQTTNLPSWIPQTAFIVGIALLVASFVAALTLATVTVLGFWATVVLLALGGSGLTMGMTGFITVQFRVKNQLAIMAGGALGVFVVLVVLGWWIIPQPPGPVPSAETIVVYRDTLERRTEPAGEICSAPLQTPDLDMARCDAERRHEGEPCAACWGDASEQWCARGVTLELLPAAGHELNTETVRFVCRNLDNNAWVGGPCGWNEMYRPQPPRPQGGPDRVSAQLEVSSGPMELLLCAQQARVETVSNREERSRIEVRNGATFRIVAPVGEVTTFRMPDGTVLSPGDSHPSIHLVSDVIAGQSRVVSYRYQRDS